MKCKIKIKASNNKTLKLDHEYRGDLIVNKLIVNSRIRHSQYDSDQDEINVLDFVRFKVGEGID